VLGCVVMARMWSSGSGRCWVVVMVLGASCVLLWIIFCGWCGVSSWWGVLIASVYQSQVPFDICELVVGLVSFVFMILPGICELLQLVGVIYWFCPHFWQAIWFGGRLGDSVGLVIVVAGVWCVDRLYRAGQLGS